MRKEPIRAVALHYTASEGRPARVYNTLRTRKNKKGEPLNLGIHFTLDSDGTIVQHADLAHVVQHIGRANSWTVGIEVVNRAVGVADRPLRREVIEQTIHGRKGKFLKYTPEQEAALKTLVKDLCTILGLPLSYPKDAEGRLVAGVVGDSVAATFRGVMGHFHVSDQKRDPLTYIFDIVCG